MTQVARLKGRPAEWRCRWMLRRSRRESHPGRRGKCGPAAIVGPFLGQQGADHVLPRLPPGLGQLTQLAQRPLQPGHQLGMVKGRQCQPFCFVHQHPLSDLMGAIPADHAAAVLAGIMILDLVNQALQGLASPHRHLDVRASPRDGQAPDHGPGLRAGPYDIRTRDINPPGQDHQQHIDAEQHQPPAEVRHPASPPHYSAAPKTPTAPDEQPDPPGFAGDMSSGRHENCSYSQLGEAPARKYSIRADPVPSTRSALRRSGRAMSDTSTETPCHAAYRFIVPR